MERILTSDHKDVAQAVTVNESQQADFEVQYCSFNSAFDKSPKPEKAIWTHFVQAFSRHDKRGRKDGPCWSPTVYKPEATRSKAGVSRITMAVFDIDDGTPFETVESLLAGYTYLAHSSFSHSASKPKYRIILPLNAPVPAGEWAEQWSNLNALVSGHADPATKDSSRLYYRPSHSTASDCEPFIAVNEGELLDVSKLSIGNGQSREVETEDLPEDFSEAVTRCQFMQAVSDPINQPTVSEPLWFAAVSNAAAFEGTDEWLHKASEHHPTYDESETDKKLEHARQFGAPHTCKYIKENGFKGCPKGGCKLPSGKATKAPAGLGFWAKSDAKEGKKPPLIELVRGFVQSTYNGHLLYVNGEFCTYLLICTQN